MNVINLNPIGRFGNQLFQYAFARAFAEQRGYELRTSPWLGEKIFKLPEPIRIQEAFPIVNDQQAIYAFDSFELQSYCQTQSAMIYTRKDAKRWFQVKDELVQLLYYGIPEFWAYLAHRRVGDYAGAGYPVVSVKSYDDAARRMGNLDLHWVTEEEPVLVDGLDPEIARFLPDFYRMTCCCVLLRGNSSFSWWAAMLSDAIVLAPIIEHAESGKENYCRFVSGNWPRLAVLSCVSDLHVKED